MRTMPWHAIDRRDLGLADGGELDVLTQLRAAVPATPIVLLGGAGDDAPCRLAMSVLMRHGGVAQTVLGRLHGLGVRLAVDDFGTGYSSLSYFTRFAIDTVKIDRSFVHRSTTNPADAVVATAIISLAKRLRHRVVAEGVETPEQLAFLRDRGCDEGQGYYFARPARPRSVLVVAGHRRLPMSKRSHRASLGASRSGTAHRSGAGGAGSAPTPRGDRGRQKGFSARRHEPATRLEPPTTVSKRNRLPDASA